MELNHESQQWPLKVAQMESSWTIAQWYGGGVST